MKKNNLLKTVLLLMFSALLLIGCRDETVSIVKQEHSEITKLSSGYYTMQQTPVFKNFLDKEYLKISKIINLKNKNAKLSQSDQQIYVVSKDDKTSYSTKINKTSTGFDILVYTIVGEKESFFVAEFVSDDKNSGDSINNFTGNVKYRTLDGKIVGDLYFKNGRPESQNSRTQRTAGCTTTTITVAISCTSQEHHMPWVTCYLSEGRAYYEVTAVTLCNEDYQDSLYNDLSGGGYFGGYDGGYDSSGERPLYGLKGVLATNIEMQTLFNNLSTDKKFFIINNFNTTEDQEFAFFSINFFSQNPNTTIEQFQNWFLSNQNIIDNLDGYPCAQDLLKQMPVLNNELAKILQDTFGTSDKVNIIFKAKEGMGTVDGVRESVDRKNGMFNVTINLNSDMLKYATKEYILVTMYHEALHAYIGYQVTILPYDQYFANFPKVTEYEVKDINGNIIKKYTLDADHKNFGSFVASLQNSIISYNSNIPSDVALAMAKWGIVTNLTNDEIMKNNNEKDTRNNSNYKGTKCP